MTYYTGLNEVALWDWKLKQWKVKVLRNTTNGTQALKTMYFQDRDHVVSFFRNRKILSVKVGKPCG
jgi:hypothetical protein